MDHFVPLLLNRCKFSAASQINSFAPVTISNCASLPEKITVTEQDLTITDSTAGESFLGIQITGSGSHTIENCIFPGCTESTIIQLKQTKASISKCRFSLSNINAIVSTDSDFTVADSIFYGLTADEGAAALIYNSRANFANCKFAQCVASLNGGAICVHKDSIVDITNCLFSDNTASKGNAIFSDSSVRVYSSKFGGRLDKELVGSQVSHSDCQFAVPKLMIDADITPVAPSHTPAMTPIPTPPQTIPFATHDKRPTRTPIPATENESREVTLIIFVSIVCALVVIVVLVVVVIFLLKKRRAMIYPASDNEEDENEPDRITVIVKNIYAVNTVIP